MRENGCCCQRKCLCARLIVDAERSHRRARGTEGRRSVCSACKDEKRRSKRWRQRERHGERTLQSVAIGYPIDDDMRLARPRVAPAETA